MMTLGVYLIVHSYVKDPAAEYSHRVILEFACWTLLIFGLGGIVSDFVFFFGHLFAFFRIFLLLKFLKLVGLAIFIVGILVAEFGNYFVVCSQIVFTLSAAALDLTYIYYYCLYEERTLSDEYDENGMLIAGKVKEES